MVVYNQKDIEVRREAEKLLRKRLKTDSASLTEAEIRELIYELEVHQIELELQNDELKQTKNILKITSEKYRLLYDFAPMGYFTLSQDGSIIDLNLAGAKLLGKNRTELKKSNIIFFVTEKSKLIFNQFLENISTSNIKQDCEIYLETTEKFPIYIHFTGIKDINHDHYLLTALDITKQKQAEKAVIEAERLGAIGEMSSAVAHDLNNSLQSILSNMELVLLDKQIPLKVRERLETVQSMTIDAATRINIVRRFKGSKQNENKKTPVKLNSLIKEVITQTRPMWKDQIEKLGLQISIVTNLTPIPETMGIEAEFKSVFYNIIKNSIEAMPKGGKITISTGQENEKIFILIQDTGIGMDDETKKRIFQPFYSTKGFEAGRGLGMSGAYSLIHEHSGEIFVSETTPNLGTSIKILIPIKEDLDLTEKNVKSCEEVTGSKRILIVDDEKSIRVVAKEMLTLLDHKVDVVCSGEEALKYLEKNTYDLVITDIGMPKMNGWQLCDKIMKKFNNKLPVAVMSGWGLEIDAETKRKYGVSFIIAKPFRFNDLAQVINKSLKT